MSVSRRVSIVALCGSLAGAACGSDPEDVPPGDRRVVLGTGEAEFEPMQGEPELELAAGVQGGFHVWASFLAYGFSSRELGLSIVTSVEGEPGSRLPLRANVTTREVIDDEGNPARTFAGFPAQVRNARCAHGRRVLVELWLTDEAGGTASDSRSCIASLEEALRATNCE